MSAPRSRFTGSWGGVWGWPEPTGPSILRLVERRAHVPEETRRANIHAAIAEFADTGFSGARVDEVAARAATTKRLIHD